MTRLLLVLTTSAAVAATTAAAGGGAFPQKIELPDGFQPEGIDIAGGRFFVGSIPTGAVYRGSLRTGEGSELVQPQAGRAAIGVDVDRGRLFVAGGDTGKAFVYDARDGSNIASLDLTDESSTFVNDVVVTKRAAWFTDSFQPVLYRLPLGPNGQPGTQSSVQTVPLGGEYVHGGGFNVNGIDATPNGKTLVIVQSGPGKLFTVTPAGVAKAIVLTGNAGNESVPNGDGILLDGKTLYVVQNRLNVVAKIALEKNLGSGRVVTRIGNADFDVPTTIAEHGKRLYAVNARFPPPPRPTPDFWLTQLRK
jgi:sugar lactone lactonase YvrE